MASTGSRARVEGRRRLNRPSPRQGGRDAGEGTSCGIGHSGCLKRSSSAAEPAGRRRSLRPVTNAHARNGYQTQFSAFDVHHHFDGGRRSCGEEPSVRIGVPAHNGGRVGSLLPAAEVTEAPATSAWDGKQCQARAGCVNHLERDVSGQRAIAGVSPALHERAAVHTLDHSLARRTARPSIGLCQLAYRHVLRTAFAERQRLPKMGA